MCSAKECYYLEVKNVYKAIIFDLDDTLYDTSSRLDDVTPNFAEMKVFDGVHEILSNIKAKKILLTHQANPEIQHKKLDALGLNDAFDEIIIVSSNTGKYPEMEKIKSQYQNPQDVVVVGDRRDTEIRYGNQMGFVTILLKQGKYKDLAPQNKMDVPTQEIKAFSALSKILSL